MILKDGVSLYLTESDYFDIFKIYGLTGKESFKELYQLHLDLEKLIDSETRPLAESMYLVDKANFVKKAFLSFPFLVRMNSNEEKQPSIMSFSHVKPVTPSFFKRVYLKLFNFLKKIFYRRKIKHPKLTVPVANFDLIENFHCSTIWNDIKETEAVVNLTKKEMTSEIDKTSRI